MEQGSARIVLDRSDATFSPGEPIRGHVVMTGEPPSAVSEGSLGVRWTVSGPAGRDEGPRSASVLDAAAVSGADTLPFEVPAPGGPFSHDGPLFSIAWALDVALRTTDGRYLEASLPIVLCPWGRGGDAPRAGRPRVAYDHGPGHGGSPPAPPPARAHARHREICAGVILAGLAASGAGAVLGAPALAAVFGIMALLCAVLLVADLARRRAAGRLGDPEVLVQPAVVRPGGTFDVRVLIRPEARVRLVASSALLVGREAVRGRAGIPGDGRRRELCRAHVSLLAEPHDVGPEEELVLSGRFVLPAGLPPTFAHPTYVIGYDLLVELAAAGAEPWSCRRTVTVSPDGAWRPDTS